MYYFIWSLNATNQRYFPFENPLPSYVYLYYCEVLTPNQIFVI